MRSSKTFDLCIFFHCSDDLQDLHSFPTRRSSDLYESRGASQSALPAKLQLFGTFAALPGRRILLRRSRSEKTQRGKPARSEEHTSELQSRRDLVCRLLLEKKKIKPS